MVPYHGTTVRNLTERDIEELYSLRGVLEAFAIQRVIENGGEMGIRQLSDSYDEMCAAAQAGDVRRVNGEDLRFHTTLIQLSNHGMLQTMWNLVSLRVRHVMALRNKLNRDLSQIAANHVPIIDAIVARNTPVAVQLIRAHVASAADLVLGEWPDADATTPHPASENGSGPMPTARSERTAL
jgi:DNA-binding GntR family transcriptional regulator